MLFLSGTIETLKWYGFGAVCTSLGATIGMGLSVVLGLALSVFVLIKLGAWLIAGVAGRSAATRIAADLGAHAVKQKINNHYRSKQ